MRSLYLFTKNHSIPRRTVYTLRKAQPTRQDTLIRVLKKLFVGNRIIVNSRGQLRLTESLELDAELPELKLAFEFQDDYHYFTSWYSQRSPEEIQQRDQLKKELAQKKGITLIQVPFWWNGNTESLIATIRTHRSDLFEEYSSVVEPIPTEIPEHIAVKYRQHALIPGVGEITQATFYDNKVNINGWMLFEKYDGIRAIWNPDQKRFISRHGKELRVTDEVKSSMPNIELDGEFWYGRGRFSDAAKISSRGLLDKVNWDDLKYMVFDTTKNLNSTYMERYKLLEKEIPSEHEFVKLAPFVICKGKNHLNEFANDIMSKGAEGIILRNPYSIYKQGKSRDYLKFKMYRDAEARVLKQVDANLWECELPNGITFQAPLDSSLLKEQEPKPGDILSFQYTMFNKSNGKPISPTLCKYRTDLSWDDIVRNHQERALKRLHPKQSREITWKRADRGTWSDLTNQKKFWDEFAKSSGFDPSQSENWSKVTWRQVIKHPNGASILRYYGGSVKRALEVVYPNLETSHFRDKKESGYWNNVDNIRKFLENFAEKNGFDPNKSSNWYRAPIDQLRQTKSGTYILSQYHNSIAQLLSHAYPNSKFNPSLFVSNKSMLK